MRAAHCSEFQNEFGGYSNVLRSNRKMSRYSVYRLDKVERYKYATSMAIGLIKFPLKKSLVAIAEN